MLHSSWQGPLSILWYRHDVVTILLTFMVPAEALLPCLWGGLRTLSALYVCRS